MTRETHPDIVVMDISMPDGDGFEACRQIRKEHPTTQVLMLTMHESEEYFLQALRMGAAGYLVKKVAPTDLQIAIEAIAQGGAFLYPGLAKALVRLFVKDQLASQHTRTTAGVAQELEKLSTREIEVLKLVAEGYINQQIANHLGLSIKTVQAHRANVMEKLNLYDITQLVRFAIHYGLISAEP